MNDRIAQLLERLRETPADAAVQVELARAYLQSDVPGRAFLHLRMAESSASRRREVRRLLGLAHLRSGDLDQALQELTAAAASDPNDAEVAAALAEAQERFAATLEPQPSHQPEQALEPEPRRRIEPEAFTHAAARRLRRARLLCAAVVVLIATTTYSVVAARRQAPPGAFDARSKAPASRALSDAGEHPRPLEVDPEQKAHRTRPAARTGASAPRPSPAEGFGPGSSSRQGTLWATVPPRREAFTEDDLYTRYQFMRRIGLPAPPGGTLDVINSDTHRLVQGGLPEATGRPLVLTFQTRSELHDVVSFYGVVGIRFTGRTVRMGGKFQGVERAVARAKARASEGRPATITVSRPGVDPASKALVQATTVRIDVY